MQIILSEKTVGFLFAQNVPRAAKFHIPWASLRRVTARRRIAARASYTENMPGPVQAISDLLHGYIVHLHWYFVYS